MTPDTTHPKGSWLEDSQQQRIVLLLEYFGPHFSGSQMQANSYTVHQGLIDALNRLNVSHEPISFSGRTDAGVHARGQVVHFDTPLDALDEIPDLVMALNAVLPDSISVKDIAITHDMDFHTTISAQWRWYRYRIFSSPTRSVWMRQDAMWLKYPVDLEAMQQGASHFLGEHSFTSFKCPHTDVTNDVCRVIHSHLHRDGDYLVFDIIANRFVYKMVRNLMGALLDIGTGTGNFTADDIPRILAARDRSKAGTTAKPQGLSLMAVSYPKPWDFFQNDIYVTTLKQRLQESSSYEQNILCKAS